MATYNILEARVEFASGQISRVTVLVEMSQHDVRAIFAGAKSGKKSSTYGGYLVLPDNAELSLDLLEQVAGYGTETVDRDKIFPNWRKKYKPAN